MIYRVYSICKFCFKCECRLLARRESNEQYLGGFTELL